MNNVKYYIHMALFNLAYMLISSSVIQTFLLEMGVGEHPVSVYMSVTQVVQVLIMLFASGMIDRLKKPVRAYVISVFVQFILLAVLLVFCNVKVAPGLAFAVIFAVSVITFVFYGIYAVLSYKIPYLIMDMANYGKITGNSGVVLGIACSVFSAALAFCVERYSYFPTISVFFALGAVMMIASAAVAGRYKIQKSAEQYISKPAGKTNLFRYRTFQVLCVPDLLRGFNYGVFLLITVVGYYCGILNLKNATVLTLLTQVSTVAGCFVYSKIAGQISSGRIIGAASVLYALVLPAMLIGNSSPVFCGAYFIANFILTFVNYGVPTIVTQIVDYECVGQYSAWRMLLHTGGYALAGAVLTPMLGAFGAPVTLIISAVCQLVSGTVYYLYTRKSVLKND